LIVHKEEDYPLPFPPSSSFLSTSCFYAPFHSTPKIADPENAQQKEKKKAQKNIEGYINSYIQKLKEKRQRQEQEKAVW
jgi:hypothetical protein